MSLVELLLLSLLVLMLLALFLLWRQGPASQVGEQDPTLLRLQQQLSQGNERLERELRDELSRSSAATRQELQQSLGRFQQALSQGLQQSNQSLGLQAIAAREAQDAAGQRLAEQLGQQLRALAQTVDQRLGLIQQDNEKKLEQMRATVDEKLHATLEQRLGESFKQVAERLEQVHQGLGEMQGLARDVGSLSRVLGNVKTRGIFGEVQLAGLLEQVFTMEQYAANVATRPGSAERVEFAIRLPGQRQDGQPLWLPIDAKFPREDYERLLDAQDRADAPAAEAAAKAIEQRLRTEARSIREKYIAPPHSTDFGILFLPTEGLYAEALRRPGLMEALQREHKVMLAGPTTLLATLNSLQMGFRTLALEKRSAEVWEVLGAVKTEFGKFGEVLAKTKKKLDEASQTIDAAETRTRVMTRKLKSVEALPDDAAQQLLRLSLPGDEEPLSGGGGGAEEAPRRGGERPPSAV
ncbi:DNA recombination protein RmuC [Paucibacter aquatile]|uniref:DNA recombination protein RmuC n=1 Tax=Kinneretia aquatilis TaxID=2070761 RepID=A0A2N8L3D5_9BURK|nr:DNA recombination protein RmuC [Paucibacter aquatile]PND40215.1 DNA recombination protein RmuC [Paucibacter aquatile]